MMTKRKKTRRYEDLEPPVVREPDPDE